MPNCHIAWKKKAFGELKISLRWGGGVARLVVYESFAFRELVYHSMDPFPALLPRNFLHNFTCAHNPTPRPTSHLPPLPTLHVAHPSYS